MLLQTIAGIMVRLMLVAAPAFVLLGAIGISNLLHAYASELRPASGVCALCNAVCILCLVTHFVRSVDCVLTD